MKKFITGFLFILLSGVYLIGEQENNEGGGGAVPSPPTSPPPAQSRYVPVYSQCIQTCFVIVLLDGTRLPHIGQGWSRSCETGTLENCTAETCDACGGA